MSRGEDGDGSGVSIRIGRGARVMGLWASLLVPAAHADPTLSPDARAAARVDARAAAQVDARAARAEAQMTPDERLALVDGKFAVTSNFLQPPATLPPGALGSAGFVPGVPRLGIPALQETDAGLGIADPVDATGHPVRGAAGDATAFPSGLATAATWDPALAAATGAALGAEAAAFGFNVVLAGGIDLTRDPRGGRDFEYAGEDPWLAGTIVGHEIRGIQSRHVISTIKHFALNDGETSRFTSSSDIGWPAARESDLLAFELAIAIGQPGAVMCAYNEVNGVHACASDMLLNRILKRDWRYPGWVMSDWGAVHAATDAAAGLDQESGDYWDRPNGGPYFGDGLRAALAAGTVSPARLADMVRRILRSEFAVGVVDHPPERRPIPAAADARVAQRGEEEGAVLLKNAHAVLPLARTIRRVAVIGGNAANGVLEGGGSSQVWPIGGPAPPVDAKSGFPHPVVWVPSSPLVALRAAAPHAAFSWSDGGKVADAVAAAKNADVAIVFADQWLAEGNDAPDLSLPHDAVTGIDQNVLIAAVAAANPRTVVVIESGGPVLMPWLGGVAGVLEAWYPGAGGGPAIAHLVFGDVNPSGHLPITFPASEAQLPRPQIGDAAHVDDDIEGAAVGYKWFSARARTPLFPFGAGLSYTRFTFAHLRATEAQVSVEVGNAGAVAGVAVAQFYLGAPFRLVGYGRVALRPGEHRTVVAAIDPRLLATFRGDRWSLRAGRYEILAGGASDLLTQKAEIVLKDRQLPP